MKKAVLSVMLILTVVALVSCGPRKVEPPRTVSDPSFNPQEINKIAVLVMPARNMPTRLIEDEFITSLMRKGYKVPSRSDLEQLMRESKFQRSGLTDGDAARLGKILNVPAVLIVSITEYDVKNSRDYSYVNATMSARLIGVEKTEILWIGTNSDWHSSRNSNLLLSSLARNIARSIPARY
jgi:hypothetical protein